MSSGAGDQRIRRVAGAVSDGQVIDWYALARELDADDSGTLRALRTLDDLFGTRTVIEKPHRFRDLGPGYALVLLIAVGFTAAGILGFVVGGDDAVPPAALQFLALTTYAAAAAFLGWSARTDPRANYLSGFFLLVACAFSVRFVDDSARWIGLAGVPPTLLSPEVFLPTLLWRFVLEFPRVIRFSRWERLCRFALGLSWSAGILLLIANLLDLTGVSGASVRRHDDGYWLLLLGLMAPALPIALVRAKDAVAHEREKIRAFTLTVVATVGVPIGVILLEVAWPAFDRALDPSRTAAVFYAIVLTFPCAASWVVVTRRPLSASFVIRRSLQYALARSTLGLCMLLSFAVLGSYVYRHREETVGDLFGNAATVGLLLAFVGAAGALATRGRLVALLNRILNPRSPDYTAALASLNHRLRSLGSVREMARTIEATVRAELDVEAVAAYLLDRHNQRYSAVMGTHRSLPAGASLAGTLEETGAILQTSPDTGPGFFRLLPAEERTWLVDGSYSVLVPLVDTGQQISGFLAIGSPGLDDDLDTASKAFLTAVAGSAVLAFGAVPDRGTVATESAADHPAFTCVDCGLASASGDTCACGGRMELAFLPMVLGGKFHLERRVGRGGMGVVYRGHDHELDRPVALKTLPRVSPEATLRLRREARTMARISHPGLATIYGLESWRAFPVLVVEYLEGATLADLLRKGPLSPAEMLRIAMALAGTLAYLHDAGWLHRDIKPNNIGFKADGTTRLLDFGLATLLNEGSSTTDNTLHSAAADGGFSEASGIVAGTPLYLSPELIQGQPPTPSSDLWALAVTLYESLAGEHPYRASSSEAVLRRISREDPPDLSRRRPDLHPSLAAFFARALARDWTRRPQSAPVFAEELSRSLI